jgi:aryl-alcohol dehydrogenase (NADP+)
MQNHYNLLYREEEREMNPLCRAEGVAITPWSPLARGLLSGKYAQDMSGDTTRAKTDQLTPKFFQSSDLEVVDRAVALAKQRGVTPAQIALAWLMHQPGLTGPIIGATKMNHLEEAVAAVDIELTTEECEYLEELYQPHPILGHS